MGATKETGTWKIQEDRGGLREMIWKIEMARKSEVGCMKYG